MIRNKIKTKKKKNPDLKSKLLQSLKSSIPLPKDPNVAFEIGQLTGIKLALKYHCDLTIAEKRSLLKSLEEKIDKFYEFGTF